MRVKLQLVLCSDDGREETVTDIVTLKKDSHRIEHLGLTLAESKQLLKLIQKRLLLDSRVLDAPMAYNLIFVTLPSLKPLFFNSHKKGLCFSDNMGT
jgi:hypothetical protein